MNVRFLLVLDKFSHFIVQYRIIHLPTMTLLEINALTLDRFYINSTPTWGAYVPSASSRAAPVPQLLCGSSFDTQENSEGGAGGTATNTNSSLNNNFIFSLLA